MCEVIERYKAEGIAEGIAEGRAEGRAEVALDMLREKMSIDVIARLTKLTVEQVKEIGKKNALI